MKVTVAAAVSVDGKLTRHDEDNIYDWISPEDQTHFRQLIAEHQVIVMGRGTYEAVKQRLKLDKNKLRIVLTSQPESFADEVVPNQLEFLNQTPESLTENLEARGVSSLLIVGGPQIISDFLHAKVVDSIYLTVEPRLFGQGKPLLKDIPVDISLQIRDTQLLNSQGTILLTYKVV